MLMIPRKGKMLWLPLLMGGVLLFSVIPLKMAQAACSNPSGNAGEIVYNSTAKVFQYCNDTNWIRMTKPSTGTGDCVNPTLKEGELAYNKDARVLQGCAGGTHVAAGPVGGGNNWIYMGKRSAYRHCAIKKDGTGWCFGNDPGDGSTSSDTFVEIAGNSTWKQISPGYRQACGIKSDDTLWCWGRESYGELGNGATTTTQAVPVQIGSDTWKKVSAAAFNTCAIKSDDTLWCWGGDYSGSIGNGGVAGDQNAPYQVGAGLWKDISVGYSSANSSPGSANVCGIMNDDTLWCWGENMGGAVGNGNTTDQTSPVQIGADTWRMVVAGHRYACAIKISDDSLWCWGQNVSGRLGNGNTTDSYTPVAVQGGYAWSDVAVSSGLFNSSTCAIRDNNALYCWGGGQYGLVTPGTLTDSNTSPVDTGLGGNIQAVSVAERSACILRNDGAILCWGDKDDDGNHAANSDTGMTLGPVASNDEWKQVFTGGDDSNTGVSCGIKQDDTLWCWTAGGTDVVPNGMNIQIDRPVEVNGGGSWLMAGIGHYGDFACGIQTNGNGYCWGEGADGRLGTGNLTSQTTPTAISGGGTWKWISTGRDHACGIKSDDSLWCWGDDTTGELGNGATAGDQSSPQAISGGGTWKRVSAGLGFSCGIKSDDTAWCWGDDASAQIGNGATAGTQTSPVAVSGGMTFKEVYAGFGTACALDFSNSLYCWGRGTFDIFGDNGATASSDIPAIAAGGLKFSKFSLSHGNWHHACGVSGQQNSLYCWGQGDNLCQTGTADCSSLSEPTIIPGGDAGYTAVSCAETHCCAIAKEKMYCFGLGTGEGILGRGYLTDAPQTTSCSGPDASEGAIIYNADANIMQYCDGAGWVAVRQ